MLRIRSKRKGFTLVETLLVASLISVVSLAIYNAFSSGLKLWGRSQQLVVEEDITLFFDRLGGELRNSFHFSKIRFKGRKSSITFPTLVRTEIKPSDYSQEEQYDYQMGHVEYYFDMYNKGFFRREANYGHAVNNRFTKERLILRKMKAVNFQYYYVNNNGELIKTEIIDRRPQVVRVSVEFFDDKDRLRSWEKIIHIPT